MKKIFYIYIFIILGKAEVINAQWTSADSVWLQNILSGKDTLRLNPEVEKAIRDGNFINFENDKTPLRSYSPNKIPIQIDLPEPKLPHQLKVNENLLDFMDEIKAEGARRPRGYDFNDILSTAFSSHYRQLKKNKKNAKAYKIYDSLPTPEFSKMQRKYFDEHPEVVSTKINAILNTQKKDSLALNDSVAGF